MRLMVGVEGGRAVVVGGEGGGARLWFRCERIDSGLGGDAFGDVLFNFQRFCIDFGCPGGTVW